MSELDIMLAEAAPPKARDALSDVQARFVDEFLIDLDPGAAAERAGYANASTGRELLKKPWIRAAVDEAIAARRARVQVDQDAVIQELAKIGFANITDVMRWGEVQREIDMPEAGEGSKLVIKESAVMLMPSDMIPANVAAAIAEVSETKDGVRVKMHDKRAALVDLGRHLGVFSDNLNVNMKAKVLQGNVNLDEATLRQAAIDVLNSV